jgi:hypothetical protein
MLQGRDAEAECEEISCFCQWENHHWYIHGFEDRNALNPAISMKKPVAVSTLAL